jgi:hypothetical protein
MVPYSAIRSAFTAKLQAYPQLPAVAWENIPFTPTAVPYLKPALVPAEPFQAEIGTNGINRHTGFYQISIFVPSGSGVAAINALVSGLCDHLKRGTSLSYGGITVSILKAYSGPTIQETDWQHVPITIQFRCDSSN